MLLGVARLMVNHRLSCFTSTLGMRVLSSAGVTRPQWSYNPVRLSDWPSPLGTTFGGATSTSPGYPGMERDYLLQLSPNLYPCDRTAFRACTLVGCGHDLFVLRQD